MQKENKKQTKKIITLFNDTPKQALCAWYNQESEKYTSIDDTLYIIEPQSSKSIPYLGPERGLESICSFLRMSQKKILLIELKTRTESTKTFLESERFFEKKGSDIIISICGYKEINHKIIDNTSKKTLMLKDFSKSSAQGFDRGEYIISLKPNNNDLQCIAKKILTLTNHCKKTIYACWYYKNPENALYSKLSLDYKIKSTESIRIPSYANEGLLNAIQKADNNELYLSSDENDLDKEILSILPIANKNFSQSNIQNYHNEGHYYIHQTGEFLKCESNPNIIHINNNSETTIYYARYLKEKLKTVAHDHIFYKEEPLPFAIAHSEIQKGTTLTLAQLDNDEVLYLGTNIDDLKVGNIQKKKSNALAITKSNTIRPTYLITGAIGKIEATISRESK